MSKSRSTSRSSTSPSSLFQNIGNSNKIPKQSSNSSSSLSLKSKNILSTQHRRQSKFSYSATKYIEVDSKKFKLMLDQLPSFTESKTRGFHGTESDYLGVLEYAKLVREANPELAPVSSARSIVPSNTNTGWLTDIQRKLDQLLSDIKKPTPAYDELQKKQELLDEKIEQLKAPVVTKKVWDNFAELDQAKLELVNSLMRPPKDDTVVVTAFNVPLKRKDIQTLNNGSWLNDEIINFYGQMILKRFSDVGPGHGYLNVHFFSTFTYTSFNKSGIFNLIKATRRSEDGQKRLIYFLNKRY